MTALDQRYDALVRRDRDWDGWLVAGVRSTGIYCVASCPARTPKRENVRFFDSAAEARATGLRPCKRCRPDAVMGAAVVVDLHHQPPIDFASLLGFLEERAVLGVEESQAGLYRRSMQLEQGIGVVEIRSFGDALRARLLLDDVRDRDGALARVSALLDLDVDPAAVSEALGHDAVIGAALRRSPGRRVPGAVDGAEIAVRAVLGQQISVKGATTLAGRLVTEHGQVLRHPIGGVTHVFPSAETLSEADPAAWAMPASRRRTVQAVSQMLASKEIVLEPGGDRHSIRERLLAIPGVGAWTADYIAMRTLADRDSFLPTDLGVRRALERLGHTATPAAATRLAERWRPYRAYAMQHLWAATG